jgi:hypothetical protein
MAAARAATANLIVKMLRSPGSFRELSQLRVFFI